jgi:hypothetical protein
MNEKLKTFLEGFGAERKSLGRCRESLEIFKELEPSYQNITKQCVIVTFPVTGP